jgi:uncharacterized membrane protein (UPF0127 family)
MLFIFPTSTKRQFWMKEMRFSIDVLWIQGGQVVAKNERLPFPSLEPFGPPLAVERVLELPAGAAHDIALGTKIIFR